MKVLPRPQAAMVKMATIAIIGNPEPFMTLVNIELCSLSEVAQQGL